MDAKELDKIDLEQSEEIIDLSEIGGILLLNTPKAIMPVHHLPFKTFLVQPHLIRCFSTNS